MAITNKEEGVWGIDKVFAKQNQGSIWGYTGAASAFVFGRNQKGQLGLNNKVDLSSPVQLPGAGWVNAKHRSSTSDGFMAVKTDGTLWAWGHSWGGGNMLNIPPGAVSSPTQVPGTTWSHDSRGKFTGPKTVSQAIKTDGTLWSAGYGTYGGLGLGHNGKISSPVQIPGSWKSVSSSSYTVMGVRTNGTLWWWGKNTSGSNGNNQGQNTTFNSPKTVGSDTTWHELQGDASTFIASKTDGSLWMWGANGSGQLGQNDKIQRSSPVQIPGTWEISANKFQCGNSTAGAINTDGELYIWGQNNWGQLGQNGPFNPTTGSISNFSSPVQIPGTWTTISLAYNAGLGVKTDGTAWVWGQNEFGGLGLNQVDANYSSPVQIPGTDWVMATKAKYGGILFANI
tara:strand:+ start:207 stop:1397 length:1191 start_codon:yes stop_codon:yes gene_type:complete